MTIATLERFPDPSRRCEPPASAATVWNLPGPWNDAADLLRSVPGAVTGWLGGGIPRDERWRLLRACLGTGGARLGALARAPDLWRRAEAGRSTASPSSPRRTSPSPSCLPSESAARREQLLDRGTKYLGEFAFELLAVIPYAYWLHRNGRLEFTISSPDTAALYYFSPRHEERPGRRRYVPITEYPVGEGGALHYDRFAFPATLDTSRWEPPPYKERFRNDRFSFGS